VPHYEAVRARHEGAGASAPGGCFAASQHRLADVVKAR
jgi:hypothetical protein